MNINKKKQTKEYIERHKLGQFFTSDKLVKYISDCFEINYDDKTILEPSFGGCAFIKYIIENSKYPKITAVDVDESLCQKYSKIYTNTKFICNDYLELNDNNKYDIIIGNPPFNIKTNTKYIDTTEGFILKSLTMLKKNGQLFFVMPSTILRNKQYQRLREEIINNYKILGIIETSKFDFLGADIETIVIGIENKKIKKQEYNYINNNYEKIIKLNNNDRYTIRITNSDYEKKLLRKINGYKLGNKFEIFRGKGDNSALRGRDLNFYGYLKDLKNGNNSYIALQNIAYRLTANVLINSTEKIADTITLLKPKHNIELINLVFISEYLNSSIANYIIQNNALNWCKLTIHIDKYYIEDLVIPKYSESFLTYLDVINSKVNTESIAKLRNEYFYNLLNLTNDEISIIENGWKLPKLKYKCTDTIKIRGREIV